MVNHLVSIVAYVTPEEKKSIERLAGGTVSNYVRVRLGLTPLRRGRGKGTAGTKRDKSDQTAGYADSIEQQGREQRTTKEATGYDPNPDWGA